MQITKEASTFYYTYALLMCAYKGMEFLIESREVSYSLKNDMKILMNKIRHIDSASKRSLNNPDAAVWSAQWNDRDFEVYGNVLGLMNDMSDEQRAVLEQFAQELLTGNVKMELETR
jgi:hypothetical protein